MPPVIKAMRFAIDLCPLFSIPRKADHITGAAKAVDVFQGHCRTGNEHAVADLMCD